MREWSAEDAEERFEAILDACLEEGPQIISIEDRPKAVLVSFAAWEDLQLKELLLDGPKFDLELPDRSQFQLRPVPDFDE